MGKRIDKEGSRCEPQGHSTAFIHHFLNLLTTGAEICAAECRVLV